MLRIVFFTILSSLFLISCKTGTDITANYTFKTECLGVEGDGSQTLRVGGVGRNRADAIEQAKKNGVRDVLFNGISNGKLECNPAPVLLEVNVLKKNEDYFNKFFEDGGEYQKFISARDGSDYHFEVINNRGKSGSQKSYRIIIRVLRSELKKQMIKDKILNN